MHVIGGLPRSGSTLLCNVINQNPKYWATSTSPLCFLVNSCIASWSNSFEVKALLDKDQEATEARLARTIRALCEAWNYRDDGRVVFDKCRGWNTNIMALHKAFPEGRALIIVRDLRNIFASIEKQHRKNPLLENANNSLGKTVFSRADAVFSPEGMVGSTIIGVEDIIRRNLSVKFIKYERFTRFPGEVMGEIYRYLDDDNFSEHDFDNVENTAEDPDAYYNNKFPHQGSGKIVPADDMEWTKFIDAELASLIMSRYPYFNKYFGYV